MPCNNITLCDGKQAERGHKGKGGLIERVLRGVGLQQTIVLPAQHRWVVMDIRPPLVKPRCPCFIRHPTGSTALLISISVSWHPGLRAPVTGLCSWRNPVHFRSSAFSNRWIHGWADVKASRFLQTCKSSVNFLVSRSDASWKEEKILLNALVSVFLVFNNDGQLQRMGHEFWVSAADMLWQDIDDFYMMKSNIDKRLCQHENVAFFLVQYHSSTVTIVSSNDIPPVTSCLYESQGEVLQKVIITWNIHRE